MMISTPRILVLVALAACSSNSDDSTTEVEELRQQLTALTAKLDSLNGGVDIAALESRVAGLGVISSANNSAIGSNTSAVGANRSAAVANASTASANTTGIGIHATTIATNTSSINGNATTLGDHGGDISANTANISTNAADISTNAANISTNAANISTNAAGGAINIGSISTNATNITNNGSEIANNTAATTAATFRSCLDFLNADPTSVNGYYQIAWAGQGTDGFAPQNSHLTVWCDMTGGGWTLIDFQDFDDGIAQGWSDPTVDTTSNCATVALSPMLGGPDNFGGGATTARTYDLYGIPHTDVRATLDFYMFDSWDNTEHGEVTLDGQMVQGEIQGGAGPNVCGSIAWESVDPINWSQQFDVTVVNHTSNEATLTITATIDSLPTNESWGADNIRLMVR